MVIPGPGLPKFGSLLETMAKRSPFGSQEKSRTESTRKSAHLISETTLLLTFQLNHFNWIIFLSHAKDFQIAEDRLLRFRVSVDFDAKEVTLILPVQFTLRKSTVSVTDNDHMIISLTSVTLNKFF